MKSSGLVMIRFPIVTGMMLARAFCLNMRNGGHTLLLARRTGM